VLARMNATYRMVLFGVAPIGMSLGGVLGGAVGLRTALVISLALMTSPMLWLFFSPVFRLKQMPDAIEALRRSTTLNPADPSPHYQLARALRLSGDTAGANSELQQFEQLRKQQPQTGGMASGVH